MAGDAETLNLAVGTVESVNVGGSKTCSGMCIAAKIEGRAVLQSFPRAPFEVHRRGGAKIPGALEF